LWRFTASSLASTTARAIVDAEALPAVTVPSFRNTGFSRPDPRAWHRGAHSSVRSVVPLRLRSSTGTIWLAKRPSLIAWAARCWLSSASAS
jgi:hypothetical protein